MNWYKAANLYEEIKRYGPIKNTTDFKNKSIEELQEIYPSASIEQIKKMKNDPYHFNVYDFTERRPYFTKNYGWSVPNEEAIKELVQFVNNQTILEIGSGHGLWAKLLQDAGAKVIPTNLPITNKEKYLNIGKKPFTNIEYINHINALKKYKNTDILMMSWPPYEDRMAYDSLRKFRGNKLIFIGEGSGGCTACDKFFNLLYEKWEKIKEIDIPRWESIGDNISIYQRK